MNKKVLIPLIFCSMLFLNIGHVSAGTLTCTTRTSTCLAGEVKVLGLYSVQNSHVELASQSNYNSFVCCSGVSGLSNSCSGTFATVVRLYSSTNSHAEQSSQSLYSNRACLSVPTGGTVTVGYQANDCTGYDTTIASMSGVTNAHMGDGTAFSTKICGTASEATGVLSVDIVDGSGSPVSSPSFALSSISASYTTQNSTGLLGASSQRIRVTNSTGNPSWSISIAATNGNTSLWNSGSNTYDFNASASSSGKLTVNAGAGTISPQPGCTSTGMTLGASTAFLQGSTDSITLLTSSATTPTSCYWDLTGVSLTQTVPPSTPSGTYTLPLTITVVAL